MKQKAVFLDRDGVINTMIYYPDHGIVDSPFTVEQFELLPGVAQAINAFHERGYLVVLVSNQPGVAKNHFSRETFKQICETMRDELKKENAFLDREYYCMHHPDAEVPELRVECDCRKPKPGMLLQAAEELDIDITQSWMIGDGLTDIQAGRAAGAHTILIGRMKCELCELMDEMDAKPDAVSGSLLDTLAVIQ